MLSFLRVMYVHVFFFLPVFVFLIALGAVYF